MPDFGCPHCKADTTQKIILLLQTGTQRGNSMTSMVGVGVAGGGLGVGGGQAVTRSFSQTDLAAKYAMPAQPSSGAGYLVMGILFAVPALFMLVFLMDPDTRGCGIATSFVFGLFSGVFLLIYFAGREGRARAAQQWQARWEYIHRAWVCLRCGHEWIPEA